jgi:YVTN family beta-propeller protein
MKKMIDLLKMVCYGAFMLLAFAACEKEDPAPEPKPVNPTSGVLILNQGSWNNNNASISYYDLKTETLALDVVDGKLGDTGQDMIIYGSKLYVSVHGSSIIYVADWQSFGELKKIKVENDGQPSGLRSLTSYNGKVYASTYDGNVIRIDTTTLSIEATTKVGSNPEGIAAVDGKLYVANSNGLNYPNYDNTLSVVDIATFEETERITVGLNPNCVMADAYGDIYLSYKGNYEDIPSGMQKVDTKTGTVSNLAGVSSNQNFTIVDDILYYFNVTYNVDETTNCTFGRYNVKTEQKIPGEIISDGTKINTAFAIGVDPYNKDIYISDTNYSETSKVYIFGSNGVYKKTIEVGISACKFVFI